MKTNILFDLDGTLTDPGEGITNSVRYALQRLAYVPKDDFDFTLFIGPPLNESFHEFCGFDEDTIKRASLYFREFFAETGLHQNKLFEEIPGLLHAMVSAGKTLHLATSKPAILAEHVLDQFDLTKFFTHLTGSPKDHMGTTKDEIIRLALEKGNINPATAIMVGDRKHDVLGAAANSIPSVGVLYGYGSRAEHEAAGATYIAENFQKLQEILLDATL